MIYVTDIQFRIWEHIKFHGEMLVNYTDIATALGLTSAKSAAVNIGVLKRHGLVTMREKKGDKYVKAVEDAEVTCHDNNLDTLEARKNQVLRAFAPITTPTTATKITAPSEPPSDDIIDAGIIDSLPQPAQPQLPELLDAEYQTLCSEVMTGRSVPKVTNRSVKLLLLEKLGVLMDVSIADELMDIRDVLLQLPEES
jgi:hypothetical protein